MKLFYSNRNLIPFKVTIARNIPNVAYMWQTRTTGKRPIIYLRPLRKDISNPDVCMEYNDPSTLLCGQQLVAKEKKQYYVGTVNKINPQRKVEKRTKGISIAHT